MSNPRPTLHTLCQATGLSLATVSRALAGNPSVTAATRERVLAAAQACNYVPDKAAVRLKTGRSGVLAYVMDRLDASQPGHKELMLGISDELRASDHQLLVLPEGAGADPLEAVRYVLDRQLADGLILTHTRADDPRVLHLQERGFPFITHGRTRLPTPHASVDWDNAHYAEAAVQALAARGRRKLALLLPDPGSVYRQHLIEGFDRGCGEAEVQGHVVEAVSMDAAPEQIFRWALDSGGGFDGWVVTREAPVLPLLSALVDAGRLVGRDVDLVIKYSSRLPHYLRIPLMGSFEDLEATGRLLARGLLERLNPATAATTPRITVIPPAPIEDFSDAAASV